MRTSQAAAIVIGLLTIASTGCTVGGEPTTTFTPTTRPTTVTTQPPATETTVLPPLDLFPRPGDQPSVTEGIPHIQLDQTSTDEILAELADWAFSLEGIVELPSLVSLPGARALSVAAALPLNSEAMLVAREFAHIHPQPNGGSLHLMLPLASAQEVVDNGWGEYHPFALDGSIPNLIMVYAPRDSQDLRSVKTIIEASAAFATSV